MKNIFKPFVLVQFFSILSINFLFAQDKFPVKIIAASSLTHPTFILYDSSSQNSTRLQFQNAGSVNFWQVKGYSSNYLAFVKQFTFANMSTVANMRFTCCTINT